MITITSGKLFEDNSSAAQAVADVAFDVTADAFAGKVAIHGLRVMSGKNGKGPWVAFPARQGQKAWFDIVTVSGALHKAICEAVLLWYGQALEARSRQQR